MDTRSSCGNIQILDGYPILLYINTIDSITTFNSETLIKIPSLHTFEEFVDKTSMISLGQHLHTTGVLLDRCTASLSVPQILGYVLHVNAKLIEVTNQCDLNIGIPNSRLGIAAIQT